MLKKILIVLALFISLFGCSSKKYSVETVDYLSILPSVENVYEYRVLGISDEEVFVAYSQPVCKWIKQTVTFDDGSLQLEDVEVCTECVEIIYAIDIDTKEYRILEQGFENYYITDFQKVNDKYVYGLLWYEPEMEITTELYYYDELDVTNKLYDSNYAIIEGQGNVFGPIEVDGVPYYTIIENKDLYLCKITEAGITKKLLATNVEKQGYSFMYTTPYVLIRKDGGVTDIYSIKDESFTVVKTNALIQVISIMGNTVYGFVQDMGICTMDVLTGEVTPIDKTYKAYTENMILFEDELWYIEDDQYNKIEFDYTLKNPNGFYVYQDEIGIDTDEGVVIIGLK